ncbi:alpha/beta hydrolase [Geothrix sp. PMB-07]|uniref:alpha/beta hydrolase n=1 Tax=Geothrix sp. PMB-07 TaxID=3068640 RepID=UPI0027411026|nr:dienelactone hydrolase family protein [Geothrix sp. PMB-07]WLT31251.1 dienelactone hydrolase family protein [Geothrix sp. PMB-07]
MSEIRTLSTTIQGRYLVASAGVGAPLLVGFHGYGQNAEQLLEDLRGIPGAERWTRVAIQALHRFYSPKSQEVVASWMTRQDREQAILDNVAYVRRVLAELRVSQGNGRLVYAGFSQGAAMAWRAVAHCGPCEGLMVLGGDLPMDVAEAADLQLPRILLGRGEEDPFYTAAQLDQDLATLANRGVKPEVVRFEGGHAWAPEFLIAAGRFLEAIQS